MVLCICCQAVEAVEDDELHAYCQSCTATLKKGRCLTCKELYFYDTNFADWHKLQKEFEFPACQQCKNKTPCCVCNAVQPEKFQGPECSVCGLNGFTCLKCACLKEVPDKYKYVCRGCRQAQKKRVNPHCSFISTLLKPRMQYMSSCHTCNMALCLACAKACHVGHKVSKRLRHA